MLRGFETMGAGVSTRPLGDGAMISGFMGSSHVFDDAICEFAVEYADQNQRDYRAFVKAVREERIKAVIES